MKLTRVYRMRRVGRKWKRISEGKYLVYKPEETPVVWMAEERQIFSRIRKVRKDLTKEDKQR